MVLGIGERAKLPVYSGEPDISDGLALNTDADFITLRKNEFPLDILANHANYRICEGCRFWDAIDDVREWVDLHPEDAEKMPQLMRIRDQSYKTASLNERVENLDTKSYEVTFEGKPVFQRVKGGDLVVNFPDNAIQRARRKEGLPLKKRFCSGA